MLAHKTNNEAYTPQLNQAKKILIVEDEALFARAVLKRMQKAGFEFDAERGVAVQKVEFPFQKIIVFTRLE